MKSLVTIIPIINRAYSRRNLDTHAYAHEHACTNTYTRKILIRTSAPRGAYWVTLK